MNVQRLAYHAVNPYIRFGLEVRLQLNHYVLREQVGLQVVLRICHRCKTVENLHILAAHQEMLAVCTFNVIQERLAILRVNCRSRSAVILVNLHGDFKKCTNIVTFCHIYMFFKFDVAKIDGYIGMSGAHFGQ